MRISTLALFYCLASALAVGCRSHHSDPAPASTPALGAFTGCGATSEVDSLSATQVVSSTYAFNDDKQLITALVRRGNQETFYTVQYQADRAIYIGQKDNAPTDTLINVYAGGQVVASYHYKLLIDGSRGILYRDTTLITYGVDSIVRSIIARHSYWQISDGHIEVASAAAAAEEHFTVEDGHITRMEGFMNYQHYGEDYSYNARDTLAPNLFANHFVVPQFVALPPGTVLNFGKGNPVSGLFTSLEGGNVPPPSPFSMQTRLNAQGYPEWIALFGADGLVSQVYRVGYVCP